MQLGLWGSKVVKGSVGNPGTWEQDLKGLEIMHFFVFFSHLYRERACFYTAEQYLTESFTIFEPQDPPVDVPESRKICPAIDFYFRF